MWVSGQVSNPLEIGDRLLGEFAIYLSLVVPSPHEDAPRILPSALRIPVAFRPHSGPSRTRLPALTRTANWERFSHVQPTEKQRRITGMAPDLESRGSTFENPGR
jgi:hypothetical protein